MPISYAYQDNNAIQRTRATMADNSYWVYIYDNLGQVISGKKYWQVNNTPVAGQQFEYTFDDIGNRKSTKVGGDAGGTSLRPAAYVVDLLNQYSQREVSGAVDILGLAVPSTAVTVNGNSTYRKGEYFHYALPVPNGGAAQYTTVTVNSGSESSSGKVFVPKTPEQYDDPSTTTVNEGYDADGNQLRDGRWNYTWDAENRLIKMESISGAPTGSRRRLEFSYDYQGRRIWRKITNLDTSVVVSETKFLYDGWNLIAELNAANSVVRKYVWGTDLSGYMQGAGGVGGLLKVIDTANGSFFCAYDGNGNVTGLIKATDGSIAAQYEYGPFGKLLRATGPAVGSMAKLNPFRFSTKYQDDETDLLYYGYRYYSAITGRWLSRDPIQEKGGLNLYAASVNDPVNLIDALGMDFIAVAGRHLDGPLGLRYNHYSIQYWLTCDNSVPNHEMEIKIWLLDNPFSRRAASVELLRDTGWRVWARPRRSGSWDLVDVTISFIRFRDRGQRFISVFTGTPATVRARWREIARLARNYEYAEQEGFNGNFQHWPNSKYQTPFDVPFNNSNTFVRDTVTRAGLQMRELGGSYPGDSPPADVPDVYGGQVPFRGEGRGRSPDY